MHSVFSISSDKTNAYEAIVNESSKSNSVVSSTRQRDVDLAVNIPERRQGGQQYIKVVHTNQQRQMLRLLQQDVTKWDPKLRAVINDLSVFGIKDVHGLQQLIDAARFQRDARAVFGAMALLSIGIGLTTVGTKTLGPVGLSIAVGLATAVFWALYKPDVPQTEAPSSVKDIALRKMGFRLLQDLQMGLAGEPTRFRAAEVVRPENIEARVKELRDIVENREHGVVGTTFAFVAEVLQRAVELVGDITQAARRGYTAADQASRNAELGQLVACFPELLTKATAAFQRRNATALPGGSPHAATWNTAADQLEWLTRGGDPRLLVPGALEGKAQYAAQESTPQGPRDYIVEQIIKRITSDLPPMLTPTQLLNLVGPFFDYDDQRGTHNWVKGSQLKLALTPDQWMQLSKEMAKGPTGFGDQARLNFVDELFQGMTSRFTESEWIELIKPWLDNSATQTQEVTERFVSGLAKLFKSPALQRHFKQELTGHIDDAYHAGNLDQATREQIERARQIDE